MLNTTEKIGWGIAVCIVIGMGIVTFTGPYHSFNKAIASTHVSSLPPFRVQIETDVKHPNLVGMYSPNPAIVHVGQQVIFTNVSNVAHTVTVPGTNIDSSIIEVGQTYTKFPTNKPGTYPYKCSIHPGMVGKLIVKG